MIALEPPQLALGTVQFGMPYGIAGAAQRISDTEAKRILADAHERGIRMLDTASVYGDIEERLATLCTPASKFIVTSKIAPIPAELLEAGDGGEGARRFIVASIDRSVARLAGRLRAVMFHRPEDLDTAVGEAAWGAARQRSREHGIGLGLSLYDIDSLPRGCVAAELDLVQCPANVFDQRLLCEGVRARLPDEIHIRSAFLQGLLLMSRDDAAKRLPAAETAVRRWHHWCEERALSPLDAALGFAKALPIRYCVFGVDSLRQFDEVAEAWDRAVPLRAPELAVADRSVIDPRIWRVVK